jgi:hydrogenase expression/formation protein HypC
MCLSDLGPVLSIDGVAGIAEVDLAGRTAKVSLAPLVLDGTQVAPGDWLLVHTGLAVELLDAADAAEIVASRSELSRIEEGLTHEH